MGIASDAFKAHLLKHCYTTEGITPLTGHTSLVARHNSTNVGIYVLTGGFNRDAYKAAIAQAKEAGLATNRLYVYADFCTYSGPSIQFVKLCDLGLPALGGLDELSVPCLFEVDPATNEATGTLAPFCSATCRQAAKGTIGFLVSREGTSKLADFGYTPHCEECGATIGQSAV